jgi:alkanesulfonate monooxygenase SsuD/methylene tetrahydromethanopterin reductase-like flavin-dependent oxidoreductase (luciferase family)
VNTGLARLAGETAQGFHAHPFHTIKYLNEVILPAIEQGLLKTSRTRQEIKISTSAFMVTSPEEEIFVRAQVAFYASTPSYRPVMALHGWEETASQLSTLASRGRWAEMPALVSDEMLENFAVIAPPDEIPAALLQRYGRVVDRLGLYIPFVPGERDEFWEILLRST